MADMCELPGGDVPDGAILEAVLNDDVAIYDVSHLLPTHRRNEYPLRKQDPRVIMVHHSGGDGPDEGFDGLEAHARYCVDHHGWAGAAYHIWVPEKADRDGKDRIAVYRAQPDATLAWGTGGMNGISQAVGFEGNHRIRNLTMDQKVACEPVLEWQLARFRLTPMEHLGYHSEADRWGGRPKARCPGPHLQAIVDEYRSRPAPCR